MKVLVACEESQEVCKAFRAVGHTAFSCDIQECSGGHPEWHIRWDALALINGRCSFVTQNGDLHRIDGRWDMIIAFPPCTHLAVSGARYFEGKREDGRQREGIEFFSAFFEADCDCVAIENPIGIISGSDYIKKWYPDLAQKYLLPRKPAQIIHPWMFGHKEPKSTCLWLKGLPKLIPENVIAPNIDYVEWVDKKTGKKKRQAKWYADAFYVGKKDHSRIRSKTFPGVARAMAEQWGTDAYKDRQSEQLEWRF